MAAEPIALWRSVSTGMTASEVKRLVPEAPVNPSPGPNKDGWTDLLVARERSNQHDQKVEFQFENERLKGVLVTEGAPFGLSPIGEERAKAILASLHETYGKPFRCRDIKGGLPTCIWIKGGKFVGYLEWPPPTTAVIIFLSEDRPTNRDLLK